MLMARKPRSIDAGVAMAAGIAAQINDTASGGPTLRFNHPAAAAPRTQTSDLPVPEDQNV